MPYSIEVSTWFAKEAKRLNKNIFISSYKIRIIIE